MPRVSNDDILYAEQILFRKTGVFDEERINFIKEARCCDLQAVPGSGKTTVLLAKLLILERYLPLPGGRGILAISHTNAAVDEIKGKIGMHCPKLLSAPNFIGTMQSFIDRFLAIPYYTNHYKKKPVRIDDEIYIEKASDYSNAFLQGFTVPESNNAKRYLTANKICHSYRAEYNNGEYILTKKYLGPKITVNKPHGNTRLANYTDWTAAEKARVYNWLMAFKKRLFQSGNLCYDDAYFLAEEYLRKYAAIIRILQSRFRFVFVDEMQDMDKNQHDLLERIFWDDGQSTSIYQRIGDKNQAIFDGDPTAGETWTDRGLVLELNGSHRLSKRIAAIVQSLALRPIAINGLGDVVAGSDIAIKPHLYVYTDSSKHLVIPEFAKTIKTLQEEGKLSFTPKYPFKAICWNTKQEEGKVRICDFHPPFSKDHHKPRVTLPTMENYLNRTDASSKGFKVIQENILNAILRILRLEHIYESEQRLFTKSTLLKYLGEKHPDALFLLKANLFSWCREIFRGDQANALTSIRNYIPGLLHLFAKVIAASYDFIHNRAQVIVVEAVQPLLANVNMSNYEGIPIEVATVHTSKGQTHTATLYLESFYQRAQGGGNYESERLAEQLKGIPLAAGAHLYVVQSIKMAYVGFSRPTHLLGFAVHKDRFDSKLADLNPDIWQIIQL
jgi:DNA helicase-2/ATP-dependent DNA helicase PcrA